MITLTPGRKYEAVYKTSVFKPRIGEWRSEYVSVIVEAISAKRVRVVECEGLGEKYDFSTCSKRQYYNPDGIAKREIGKIKLASNLHSIEEVSE